MRRVLLAATCLTGCDSLASKDYVGEPLFTLAGSFASTPTGAVGGVALLWQDARGAGGPGVAATTVPVALAFPASFRVDVPVPPPNTVRFQLDDGVALAEAYVYVVADAAQLAPRGSDRGHVLVFASADVADGTLSADYLGGPISAGYHLRRFAAGTPGTAQAQLIERCVAGGAARDACTTRRSYQLAPIGDDDPLRIVVTPP
jgi:hypothetical protein